MSDDPKGNPPEFVLQLDAVTKSYNPGAPNAVAVLRGASLQLRPGEIVALVAPSGAGNPRCYILQACWISPIRGG